MIKPSPAELYTHVLRTNFLTFMYAAYRELYGKPLKRNWHHAAMAHAFDTVLTDERKLCIFMPPRNLKSFIVSVAWPAFLLGRDASLKIVVVSYGEKLAEELAYACRRLMMTPFYQELFPGTQIKGRSAIDDFQTTRGGGRRATSIGGATTGVGGEILIIDDPIKADAVDSEAARLQALNWFQSSFATRGDDKLGGAQILVMQRLHEEDLGGIW